MKKFLITAILILSAVTLTACKGDTPATTPNASGNVSTPHTHAFGEWQTVTDPTCTEEGLSERACECGEKESKKLDTLEHSFVATVIEPTCTEPGHTVNACACGKSYNSDKTQKLGHDFGEWYVESPASCLTEGQERSDCKRCGSWSVRELPITEHSFGEWQTVSAPTCGENGEERRECTGYGCEKYETRELDAIGGSHVMGDWENTVAPTCLEHGEKTRKCTKCAYTETTRASSYGGHSFGEWQTVKESTCTSEGEKKRACKNPGCTETQTESIPASHELGDWIVVTPSNCKVTGESRRSCGKCDFYETQILEISGHTYTVWTSTSADTESSLCDVCQNQITRSKILSVSSATVEEGYTIRNPNYVANSTSKPYRRQGGCVGGGSAYQVLITKNEETACILKLNIATGEVTYSKYRPMGHGNDMTYDADNHCVYVISGSTLYVYDADTLEYKGTKTLSGSASAISYNAHNDTFLGMKGGVISTYDANGKSLKKSFTMTERGVTSQSICSDEKYIYALFCTGIGSSKYTTHVYIYDYSGNFINMVTVRIPANFEPENISIVNGDLYIGTCTTQPVVTFYKVVPEK